MTRSDAKHIFVAPVSRKNLGMVPDDLTNGGKSRNYLLLSQKNGYRATAKYTSNSLRAVSKATGASRELLP
jgi:hypothetical protein